MRLSRAPTCMFLESLKFIGGMLISCSIAQAKTGTGKTIGFLLPILQNIIKEDPSLAIKDRFHRASPSDLRAIIIPPTRELAEQIAEEARKLPSRTNVIVQTAVGGTQKSYGLRMIQQ